jgi:MoaA/NifB/PqqE/SkfB family radical SAM enzyme
MDVARRAVNAGIMSVFFTGGEPLLAEYLFEVVSYLLRNGINVDIATNGALIESRIENLLAVDESLRPYLNLQVKLDTVDGENYAKLMGFPDPGLDSVLRGIDLLDENGFGFTIKYAITPETVRDVPKIADTMLSKANLMAINFDTVFPIGRGNNLMGSPWMAWTTDRKKEMLTVISEQVRKAPDKVVYDNVLDEWVPLNKSELGNPVYDCKAARMFLRLKSNGQLAPCNSTRDTEVGLLGSQSIQEAWENSEGLKKIRKNGIWCPLRRGIPKDLEEIKEFAVKLKLLTLTKK